MADESTARLAVLIDGDNAQPDAFEYLLPEIAKYGEATVKRIYGDFTSPQSTKWKAILNQFAIKPVQQFAYTKGKNATDSSLIIDAMDLLYTRRFDGFCLVSSDSDFTGIATRIREEGLLVYGYGRKTTPDAFKNACHRFIITELLLPRPEGRKRPTRKPRPIAGAEAPKAARPNRKSGPEPERSNELPIDFMVQALEESADDSGWANLGTFGRYLNKLRSDFDARQYGYAKLSDLVRDRSDMFEIQERKKQPSDSPSLYLRAIAED